jgi:hypothetical protein
MMGQFAQISNTKKPQSKRIEQRHRRKRSGELEIHLRAGRAAAVARSHRGFAAQTAREAGTIDAARARRPNPSYAC